METSRGAGATHHRGRSKTDSCRLLVARGPRLQARAPQCLQKPLVHDPINGPEARATLSTPGLENYTLSSGARAVSGRARTQPGPLSTVSSPKMS